MAPELTARRKDAHLDIAATAEVEPPQNRTLFDCVHLVHCAMPELAVSEVDAKVPFLGKTLRYPLMMTGMTGGTPRASEVNRALASLAEKYGVAFGVGSQRAMSEDPSRVENFAVRDVAPTVALLGNIGLQQAVKVGASGVEKLAKAIGADGMAVHLNPAQELTQPEGDRDFRGGYRILGDLARAFGDRLVVKETGCGISPTVALRLQEVGVRTLDVSGLGGTSWVRVEQLRTEGVNHEVGAAFSGWGIPTAAAVASVRRAVGPQMTVVASGGIRNGLDAAKAMALGADVAGMALPLFKALQAGGPEAADRALQAVVTGVVQALVLTGCSRPTDLRGQGAVITGDLKDWLSAI